MSNYSNPSAPEWSRTAGAKPIEMPSATEVKALLDRVLPELRQRLLFRLVGGEALRDLALFAVLDDDASRVYVGCASHDELSRAARVARAVLGYELPDGFVWAMISLVSTAPAFVPVDVRDVVSVAASRASA
ncbi:MAG TPA: hypothetical protein VKZ49_13920 [Polyangiaceae bacterium]|nr:hypothetical protein [Polyangiaceae bacterium]